jgi:FG-GAP-like repeat
MSSERTNFSCRLAGYGCEQRCQNQLESGAATADPFGFPKGPFFAAARVVLTTVFLALSATAPASETTRYTYDALGRFVSATHSGPVNQGASSSYSYDRAGNRTNVTVLTSWTSRAYPTGDFNGDGRSDILWRDDSSSSSPAGVITDWLSSTTGSWIDNWANAANAGADLTWKIAGVGDFNGDGRSDILWRNDDGTVTDWVGDANGGFTANWANFHNNPGSMWQVVGTGDFNGDGVDDVLLRSNDGTMTDWLGQSNGGFFYNWYSFNNNPGSSWQVVGTGDFNGDGFDDVLLRSNDGIMTDWLGQPNGGFFYNWNNFSWGTPSDWHPVAIGDVNGDGRSDIMWRNDDGTLGEWQGNSVGAFAITSLYWSVDPSWRIAATGNFNGPGGSDDILLRNRAGDIVEWLGTSTGEFVVNSAGSSSAGTTWNVEPK